MKAGSPERKLGEFMPNRTPNREAVTARVDVRGAVAASRLIGSYLVFPELTLGATCCRHYVAEIVQLQKASARGGRGGRAALKQHSDQRPSGDYPPRSFLATLPEGE